jgi:two-component SAPR family response regulator
LGDEIYCDYREALSLILNMKEKNNRTKKDLMKLLNIVSFGELLPNLEIEWVDPFKANFANLLIDLLIDVSKQKELAFSPYELVYLADIVLIFDVLNDDALKLKCCSLVKMGKNGLARAAYNSFVKQYSVLFGTKYSYSFTEIVS